MRRSHFVGVIAIFNMARCVQRDEEPPREYLARWMRVREPLEGGEYHFAARKLGWTGNAVPKLIFITAIQKVGVPIAERGLSSE